MARAQQPEAARSAKTDVDPDLVETGLADQPPPSPGETGPIPVDNQPGHHPPKEQDKPDLDAFAAKLGADPKPSSAPKARKSSSPGPAPATGTPAKSAPSKPAATRAKAPAWPESAPADDDLGPIPDPARDHLEQEPEPRLVGLVLLPLRETVKRLEQLDRSLTERLTERVHSVRGGRGPTA